MVQPFAVNLPMDHGYLEVLGVANPAKPVAVGHYDSIAARNFAMDGGLAWMAGVGSDLGKVEVVDVSDPGSPRGLGILAAEGLNEVAAAGNRAFLAGQLELTIAEFGAVTLPPRLEVLRSVNALTLSWPASAGGFHLESARSLVGAAADWEPVPASPDVVGDRNVVALKPGDAPRFFRLKKP